MQANKYAVCSNRGWRIALCLLTIIALATACTVSQAQAIRGTNGGWQTWNPVDLNDDGFPYWDQPWSANGGYGPNQNFADKNAGFCLTSTGDCQGIGSALYAPGVMQFWGTPFTSGTPAGGQRDNTVFFRSTGGQLRATLFLNASAVPTEINEFGWFETNSSGSLNGRKHILFQGTGEPTGSLTPSPVGTTVVFTPTQYFGYYYSDVSEPACPDGTSTDNCPTVPDSGLHGCYAYTSFYLNDAKCLESTGNQGDHDFVVFSPNPTARRPTYWIAGEDPADCANADGDCNLTIVRVTPVLSN